MTVVHISQTIDSSPSDDPPAYSGVHSTDVVLDLPHLLAVISQRTSVAARLPLLANVSPSLHLGHRSLPSVPGYRGLIADNLESREGGGGGVSQICYI